MLHSLSFFCTSFKFYFLNSGISIVIFLPDIRAVTSAAAIVADTISSCQVSVRFISFLTNRKDPDTTP